MTDSATQSAKQLPWENLEVSMGKFNNSSSLKKFVRFRLFALTKRDIVVAGRTSGGIYFDNGGCSFSREIKCSLDSQKILPFLQPQKKMLAAWVRADDLWYNFGPMTCFHWGAGRLSPGIGHVRELTFCLRASASITS